MSCNPLHNPTCLLPPIGGPVAGSVLDAIDRSLGGGIRWIVVNTTSWWIQLPSPDLSGAAVTRIQAWLLPVTIAVAVGGLIAALHDVLGGNEDAVIVGHDWGALATYGAVAHQPDRWRRAVTAAVPPTASIGMSLFTYASCRRAGTCSSSFPPWPRWPSHSRSTPSSTTSGATGHRATTAPGTSPG